MNIDVFVSYHRRSSEHIMLALVNALESRGVRCWYAPRDVFGDYASAICSAIDQARVFLLIATKEAALSEDVLNEINLAVDRVRKREELAIVPFRIDETVLCGSMKYYLSRQHWIDAIDPPTQEQIGRVVHQVLVHLGKEAHQPAVEATSRLVSSMPAPREKIEGRAAAVEEIHDRLQQGQRLFICGMGGIGKSQVVKKYAQDHRADYDTQVFVSFSGTLQDTLISDTQLQISGMERGSADAEVYYQRKLSALRQMVNDRTLLVLDNFDVTGDPHLEDLLALPCHLLITTRTDFSMEGLDVMYLDAIDDDALLQVFRNNYPRLTPQQIPASRALIDLLGRHTMAVEIIARQLVASRKSIEEMIDLLSSRGIHGMDLRERVRYDVKKSAETSYNIFRTLFSLENLTEAERSVLADLALVPISGIDARSFHDWAELETYEDIDNLIQRNWIQRTDDDVISLHPLVAEVVTGELLKQFPVGSRFINSLLGDDMAKFYTGITPEEVENRQQICLQILSLFPHPDEASEPYHLMLGLIIRQRPGYEAREIQIQNEIMDIRRRIYPRYHVKNIQILFFRLLSGVGSEEQASMRAELCDILAYLEAQKAYFMAAQVCVKLAQSFYYRGAQLDEAYGVAEQVFQFAERATLNINRMDQDPDPAKWYFRGMASMTPTFFRGNYHHFMATICLFRKDVSAALAHQEKAVEILMRPERNHYLDPEFVAYEKDMTLQSLLGGIARVRFEMADYERSCAASKEREQLLLKYRKPEHERFLTPYRNLIKCGAALGDESLCHEYRRKLASLLDANYATDDPRYVFIVKEYGLEGYAGQN